MLGPKACRSGRQEVASGIPVLLRAGFALLQILVAAKLFTVGHNADQVHSHPDMLPVGQGVTAASPTLAPHALSLPHQSFASADDAVSLGDPDVQ